MGFSRMLQFLVWLSHTFITNLGNYRQRWANKPLNEFPACSLILFRLKDFSGIPTGAIHQYEDQKQVTILQIAV